MRKFESNSGIIAIFLTLILALSLVPANIFVFAAETTQKFNCNKKNLYINSGSTTSAALEKEDCGKNS